MSQKHSLNFIAESLGISRTSFYYHPKQPNKDWQLKCQIEAVLEEHKDYGYRRVARHLGINRKRAQRVMRLYGIKAYRRRGKKWRKPRREAEAYSNLLRRVTPSYPGHVWVADFTYLPFAGKFVYLATVMDVHPREIVGWALQTRHSLPLVQQALFNAMLHKSRPTIFHSDNGSEYDSEVFKETLTSVGTQISRSTPGCPWENGYQESFYSRFKLLLGDTNRFSSLGELVAAVHQELYRYNTSRIHSALTMSPVQFRHEFIKEKV